MRFLAADIGASSGRTIVGEVTDGSLVLTETHRFKNEFYTNDAGEMHWDIQNIVNEIKIGIDKSGDIDGIGIDTWGVDFGLLDAEGNLLCDPFAYRDPRNDAAMAAVLDIISSEDLYKIAGLQEMTLNTIFQIYAYKMHTPELLEKADKLLLIPDLIGYFLTGDTTTEYTIASTSGLLDARTGDWSGELFERLGLPSSIFGKIVNPGTTCGEYNGIPLYKVGSHDTASAVVSVPATKPDGAWAFLSSGTWSLIGAELDTPILTDKAIQLNYTNEGGINKTIRFLKNVNGLWLIQECQRMWKEAGQDIEFADIAKAAEESQNFTSTINPDDDAFTAPVNMLDAITDHCKATGQKAPETVGEFAFCCYNSLAKTYKEKINGLEELLGAQIGHLYIVGGGTQATLLNQLTANYCQIPVHAGPVEATAIGNIAVQAMANGTYSDLTDIRSSIAEAFDVATFTAQ